LFVLSNKSQWVASTVLPSQVFYPLLLSLLAPHPSFNLQIEKDQLIAYGYNVRHLVDGQRGDIYLPTLVPNMSSIRVKQVATATHHHLVLAGNLAIFFSLSSLMFYFCFYSSYFGNSPKKPSFPRTPQFYLADGTVYTQGILTARRKKLKLFDDLLTDDCDQFFFVHIIGGPESNPRYLTKVEELDGIRITFVAAGVGYHSLAISGKFFSVCLLSVVQFIVSGERCCSRIS